MVTEAVRRCPVDTRRMGSGLFQGVLATPAFKPFKLRILHILLGGRLASLKRSMGTHSWKLWAANYVWTRLKSTPLGLDYVADSRVCSTQGGRTQRLPLELGHPPLSDVPEYPL